MNHDMLSELVTRSQSGDEEALVQLLLQAYPPVSYLAKKTLQNERTASQVIQEVLDTLAKKINTLADASMFESWVCRIAAARCMQAMPVLHRAAVKSVAAPHWEGTLDDAQILSEAASADVIQDMVDSLPEAQRLCILLLCCGGLGISAISQLTGFPASSVKEYLIQGQNTIQTYLSELQERGIEFTGVSSLTEILHDAMFRESDDGNAVAVVYGLLGKEVPVPFNPAKWVARILGVVLGGLVIAFVALVGILVTMMV